MLRTYVFLGVFLFLVAPTIGVRNWEKKSFTHTQKKGALKKVSQTPSHTRTSGNKKGKRGVNKLLGNSGKRETRSYLHTPTRTQKTHTRST